MNHGRINNGTVKQSSLGEKNTRFIFTHLGRVLHFDHGKSDDYFLVY